MIEFNEQIEIQLNLVRARAVWQVASKLLDDSHPAYDKAMVELAEAEAAYEWMNECFQA